MKWFRKISKKYLALTLLFDIVVSTGLFMFMGIIVGILVASTGGGIEETVVIIEHVLMKSGLTIAGGIVSMCMVAFYFMRKVKEHQLENAIAYIVVLELLSLIMIPLHKTNSDYVFAAIAIVFSPVAVWIGYKLKK